MPAQSLLIQEVNSTFISLNLSTWIDGGCPILRFTVELQTNVAEEWHLVADDIIGHTVNISEVVRLTATLLKIFLAE